MTRENILKFLLEEALSLNTEKELYLIKENISSINDPEFIKKANYYTRFSKAKNEFNSLSDKDKIYVINLVDKVVNGSSDRIKYETISPRNSCILTMLASEYVSPLDVVDNWLPDNVNKESIFKFILAYYNPIEGSTTRPSSAAVKAASGIMELNPYDIDIDIILNAYTDAIEYLLLEGNYDPNGSPFDFIFFTKWQNRILDSMRYKKRRKDINISPVVKGTDAETGEDEETKLSDLIGQKDTEYTLMSDVQKYDFILDNLENEDDKKILKAYYNFIFSEQPNDEIASRKLIDAMYDNNGDIAQIGPEELGSQKKKESLYDYIAKELGMEFSKETKNTLASKLKRARERFLELFRKPTFKKTLGLEDWSEKDLDILRATGAQPYEFKDSPDWKEIKSRESEFKEKSGTAYDKYGRPIELDDKGKPIPKGKPVTEIMMECVYNINNNFNNKLDKIITNLNRINLIDELLSEGNEIAVKDLDQDIYNYIKETVDGLTKASYMLNELEMISNDIKFDYPEVSEKINEYISPLNDKIFKIIVEVKSIKEKIKPYLNESSLKKKDEVNEDELEEERITNPDSKDYVRKRENFIGSHIYGEDLGGLGKMYVAYSYGEQFPVYVWHNGKWYHNSSDYVLDDGTVNEPTNQHKKDMRPSQDTHGLSTYAMNTIIRKFKKKHGLGDNVHTDVEPGEKN